MLGTQSDKLLDSSKARALIPIGEASSSDGNGEVEEFANGGEKTEEEKIWPEPEIPANSSFMMDTEAAELMQSIKLACDPCYDIKFPKGFDSALSYATRDGMTNVKSEKIKEILQPLKEYGVSEWEICLIANLNFKSVDEVFDFVPSVKPKIGEEPLGLSALVELASARIFG